MVDTPIPVPDPWWTVRVDVDFRFRPPHKTPIREDVPCDGCGKADRDIFGYCLNGMQRKGGKRWLIPETKSETRRASVAQSGRAKAIRAGYHARTFVANTLMNTVGRVR